MKRLLSTFAVLALATTTATTSTAWIKHTQQFNADKTKASNKTTQNETAQDIANKLEGKTINLPFNEWVGQKIMDNISLFQNDLVNQGLLTQDEAQCVYNGNVTWMVLKQEKAPGCAFLVKKDGQTASAGDITLNIYTGYKVWNFNNVLYANDPAKEQLLTSTDGGTTWKSALGGGQVAWMKMVHGIIFLQFTFSSGTTQHIKEAQSILYFIRPETPLKIYNIGTNDPHSQGVIKAVKFMVTYSDWDSKYYVYMDFPFYGNHVISTTNPNATWSVDYNGSGAGGNTFKDNLVNQMFYTTNYPGLNPDEIFFNFSPCTSKGFYGGVNRVATYTDWWAGLPGSSYSKHIAYFPKTRDFFQETSQFGLWQKQGVAYYAPVTPFNRQWDVNATAINQVIPFNKGYCVATTNGLYYWYPKLVGWKEAKMFAGQHYVVDWMQNINNTLYVDTQNAGLLKSYMTPSGKVGFIPLVNLSNPGLTVSSVQEKLGVIYAFTNQGVYQSFNNGNTFEKNKDLANINMTAVNKNSIVSEGNNVTIVANGYAYKSTDGGFTFATIKL